MSNQLRLEKKIKDIENKLEPGKEHLYIDNKLITSQKTIKAIKEEIKKEYEKPEENIHGFIISLKINKTGKSSLTISCTQITITPKLFVGSLDDDAFQIFTYSNDELLKYGFKISHIKKIMKAKKKNTISFEKNSIPISDILEE